jgi:hypothetical protein
MAEDIITNVDGFKKLDNDIKYDTINTLLKNVKVTLSS